MEQVDPVPSVKSLLISGYGKKSRIGKSPHAEPREYEWRFFLSTLVLSFFFFGTGK